MRLKRPLTNEVAFVRMAVQLSCAGSSSIGRATVSKTVGCGFESCLPCHFCVQKAKALSSKSASFCSVSSSPVHST